MAASWIEKLRKALPWIGVVFLQLVNVGNTIITKAALSEGMHFSMLSCFRNMIASILDYYPLPGLDQNFLYAGSKQTPAGFLSCMAGVRPALTFIAAWICSLETVRLNQRHSQAKLIEVRRKVSWSIGWNITLLCYFYGVGRTIGPCCICSGYICSEYGDKQQGPGICHCLQPLVNDFGDIIWINSTRRKCAFRKCDRSDSDYRWIVHFIMGQKRERRSAVGGLAVGYSMVGWIDESGTLVESLVNEAVLVWAAEHIRELRSVLLLYDGVSGRWLLFVVGFCCLRNVGSPVWPAAGLVVLCMGAQICSDLSCSELLFCSVLSLVAELNWC
ncbi:WAT1-related protein [Camellia lanceoleosa]|nr:WAT1-related protein [Camellia lanceoleosa]